MRVIETAHLQLFLPVALCAAKELSMFIKDPDITPLPLMDGSREN